jgi:hypothetical protein
MFGEADMKHKTLLFYSAMAEITAFACFLIFFLTYYPSFAGTRLHVILIQGYASREVGTAILHGGLQQLEKILTPPVKTPPETALTILASGASAIADATKSRLHLLQDASSNINQVLSTTLRQRLSHLRKRHLPLRRASSS